MPLTKLELLILNTISTRLNEIPNPFIGMYQDNDTVEKLTAKINRANSTIEDGRTELRQIREIINVIIEDNTTPPKA